MNDGLLAYYRANAAPNAPENISLAGLERLWLGFVTGSLNPTSTIPDLWMRVGELIGATGTINDIQLAYWSSQ